MVSSTRLLVISIQRLFWLVEKFYGTSILVEFFYAKASLTNIVSDYIYVSTNLSSQPWGDTRSIF